MRRLFAIAALILLASCSSGIKITSNRSVITEDAVDCTPSGGAVPALIDTACTGADGPCYKIRPLADVLQSGHDDFGLSIASDPGNRGTELLVFTSTRPGGYSYSAEESSQNLWTASRNTDGTHAPAAVTLNARIVHEGAPALSPDGQWMYFAAKNRPDTLGDCDIYQARIVRNDGGISLADVRLVDGINSTWFDSHPSLSADGMRLCFTSDRPGGLGNADLWMSERSADGTWRSPRNLGPRINSTCNEMTPFLCADNRTLYFASDGYNSVGGLDVFLAEMDDAGQWSAPVNAGRPLNTLWDEMFPATPPNARADSLLTFTSNRPGGAGGYDLYAISPNPQPPSLVTLRGRVRSARSGDPVPGAALFWMDRGTGDLVATVHTNERGEYYVVLPKGRGYDVGAQAEKYFYDTFPLDTPREPGVREYEHDFRLGETLDLRINFPFNDAAHPLDYVLDAEGNSTGTTWKQSLEFLALNIRSYGARIQSIVLAGHTDSVGSSEYNRTLARQRAEFVRDALVREHGITPSLITVTAVGEDQLPARGPGESDEVYNTRCRRVELIKVVQEKKGGTR